MLDIYMAEILLNSFSQTVFPKHSSVQYYRDFHEKPCNAKVKVKVKLTLEQARKAQSFSRGIAVLLHYPQH
jgi:hypothetical protein